MVRRMHSLRWRPFQSWKMTSGSASGLSRRVANWGSEQNIEAITGITFPHCSRDPSIYATRSGHLCGLPVLLSVLLPRAQPPLNAGLVIQGIATKERNGQSLILFPSHERLCAYAKLDSEFGAGKIVFQ